MADDSWATKYGSRRVRRDPPTIEEAITAAQGLSDQVNEQIEIAAGFMDVPVDFVRAEMRKAGTAHHNTRVVAASAREGRAVIVERKPTRRTKPAGL